TKAPSHKLEPPENPGRFNQHFRMNAGGRFERRTDKSFESDPHEARQPLADRVFFASDMMQ
ncbi:hypothetical protein, partial [Novosphingobium sp.]|uniref:hypothetical protein n=1 Tax=Novosphingobium sp. TaxID=1874826 RepID=UPI002FE03E35